MSEQSLFLPVGYVSRTAAEYFDDTPFSDSEIVYQPEVYEIADYLCRSTARTTVIDFGCGNGRKLRSVSATRHIGIDFGSNIIACRERFADWGDWLEADFSVAACVELSAIADENCVVVCSDVVEHLVDPQHLLALLAACYARGAIVITSTPDRPRTRGVEHMGPPPNPSHIREWALAEYVQYLGEAGLPATFAGYTLDNNVDKDLSTILTLHDPSLGAAFAPAVRPLAILAAFNEVDVIGEVMRDWIAQGCDLRLIDNWSDDGTWEVVQAIAAQYPERIEIERFPEAPAQHYEWRHLLRRKEDIAVAYPGRWIIHTDADELRRSPFPSLNIAQAMALAEKSGANRLNFTLMNFRPVHDRPYQPGTLGTALSYFEFGTQPDQFVQAKAWLQGIHKVDLLSTGGHVAVFDAAIDFPYKFALLHFPIRSPDHGRQKVFAERQKRWSPEERAMGWHIQYDGYSDKSTFLWRAADLQEKSDTFWQDHGLAIITDVPERGLRRQVKEASHTRAQHEDGHHTDFEKPNFTSDQSHGKTARAMERKLDAFAAVNKAELAVSRENQERLFDMLEQRLIALERMLQKVSEDHNEERKAWADQLAELTARMAFVENEADRNFPKKRSLHRWHS